MAEYKVYFDVSAGIAVRVEAEDVEDAIQNAYDSGPSGICAHCSGWGQKWSRDESDDRHPFWVTDAEGNEVWREPTPHERVIELEAENSRLRKELEAARG